MTLLDFCRLIRRYLALVIVVPMACVAVCMVYLILSPSPAVNDEATSRIVVNSQIAPVTGIASSESRQRMLENPNFKILAKGDSGTMTVTITVSGAEEAYDNAVIANDIADNTVAIAEDFYADAQEKANMVEFKAQVEYADSTAEIASDQDAGKGGKAKYLLGALLGGLFIVVFVIVVIDMIRRPVKSVQNALEVVDVPVLGDLPVTDGGERLLANLRFASKGVNLSKVAVIPVGVITDAEMVAAVLNSAAKSRGEVLVVASCDSMVNDIGAAYAAQDADVVVVTVCQWSDSLRDLEETVAELKLVNANLVGLVYVGWTK